MMNRASVRIVVYTASLISFILNSNSWAVGEDQQETVAETIAKQGQAYVLTPEQSTVYPVSIYEKNGEVIGEDNLLTEDGRATILRFNNGGKKPYVILDMGRASAGGYPVFMVKSHTGTPVIRLAYSNHPLACGETGDFTRGSCTYLGVDLPVLPANPGRYELYSIPRDGMFIGTLIQGQERYVRIQLDTEGTEVEIDSLSIANKDVHDRSPMAGYFLCNNEIINQIWYASAWTLQIASFPNHNAWTNVNGWLIPRKLERANDVGLSKRGVEWKDYTFEFDFEIRTNPDDISHAGWAFRAVDNDNCYVAAIDLNGMFTLNKRVGGEYTTLKQTQLPTKIIDGVQYHVKVVLKGNEIATFLNGKQVDVTHDSTYRVGRVGFWHPKEKWFLIDNVNVSNDKELLNEDFAGDLEQWGFTRTLSYISDGAKRDRLVWSGDLDWAGRNVYYAFDNATYLRDSLKMLTFNQTPEGYIHAAPYPENMSPPVSGDYGQFESDEFSAWIIPVAWDYLLYTGDTETLCQIYLSLRKDMEYLLGYVDVDGLFDQRLETSKHASNLTLGDTGKRSYINILVWDSLKKMALIAGVLGKDEDVGRYSKKAEAMKNAIIKYLWNEQEGYIQESKANSGFYHTSNSLAMSTKLLSPEQAARLQKRMGRHSHGKFQSLMIRGKFEYDYSIAAIEDFFAHNWPWLVSAKEVPLSVTECMHKMRGGWGDDSHPDTSVAHIFSGYVLGIIPTSPGYETYEVKPHLTDRISWAKGIVPTPRGGIVASWELKPEQFTYTLNSPKGTNVTIALPIAGLKDYRVSVNNQNVNEEIGKTESDGNYFYLRDMSPGVYSCVVDVLEGSFMTEPEPVVATVAKGHNLKWKIKASTSHEQGGWGLSKLIDGVTISKDGTKGYSSKASDSPDSREWIEVDLGEKKSLKKIIFYPRTDIQTATGESAGFPVELTVLIKDSQGKYKKIKTLSDIPNPKGKALAIDLYTVVGFHESQYVRVDVNKLGIPAADEPMVYRLQLSEMEFVFDE